MKVQHAALLAVAFSGFGVASCTSQGSPAPEPQTGQSSDLLLGADGGMLSVDGGPPCASCIESSCGPELSALETDLMTLRTEARSAFTCAVDSRCLALFVTDRDAGRSAVADCVAGCAEDAGLPPVDAAVSGVRSLATALDSCVTSSCASKCPFVERELAEEDAEAAREASDGGLRPDGATGFRPPPPFFGRR
jgi:hypothetical protein